LASPIPIGDMQDASMTWRIDRNAGAAREAAGSKHL
jgi:hypothetical protein